MRKKHQTLQHNWHGQWWVIWIINTMWRLCYVYRESIVDLLLSQTTHYLHVNDSRMTRSCHVDMVLNEVDFCVRTSLCHWISHKYIFHELNLDFLEYCIDMNGLIMHICLYQMIVQVHLEEVRKSEYFSTLVSFNKSLLKLVSLNYYWDSFVILPKILINPFHTQVALHTSHNCLLRITWISLASCDVS